MRLRKLSVLGALVPLAFQVSLTPDGSRGVQDAGHFTTGSTAILVDVVVRDRSGQPLTDLRPDEFELREDGVAQVIGSVSKMWLPDSADSSSPTDENSIVASLPPRAVSGKSNPAPSVVALVFERLTPESRLPAMNAALQYARAIGSSGSDYHGVFVQDLSLRVVQPFTIDRQRLEAGIRIASNYATSYAEANRIGLGTGLQPTTIGAEFGGGLSSASMAPDRMADLAARAQDFRGLDVKQRTSASLDGLRSLVVALSEVRGRKAILYFSDGLALYAPGVKFSASEFREKLDALIALANRVNVSVYPIDTVGLRVHSQDLANAAALRQAAIQDLQANADPSGLGGGSAVAIGDGIVQGGTTGAVFERLASGTGGIVIENTNDLTKGLRVISEDRRFYYLLTYAPRNQDFHGETRTLQVLVHRRGVKVFSRKSYLALSRVVAPATPAVESQAWGALQMRPLPRNLPFDGVVLNVMNRQGEPRVLVALGTRAETLTIATATTRGVPRVEAVFVAQMRDVNGAIVRKASEVRSIAPATTPVRLSPAVLFVREPTLPAGQYMLEAAVHDLNSDRLAAKYLPLTVPAVVSNGIALGDLLLVQRIGLRNGDETRHESVLDAQDGIIVPRLDRTFVIGVDQAVAFFTRARWFDQRQTVVAKVSLLEGLTTIGEGVLAPKLTNTPGVAEVAGTIPLAGHGPGTYTLRVTLEDDGAAVRKETEIRIVERPTQP